MEKAPGRIVSLLPSATEILCALGLSARLVGRSHECDFPEEITSLPVLTRPLLDPSARGSLIHEAVLTRAKAGLSLYAIEEAALASLRPDLIVTQDQCDVCAVSLKDVEAAAQQLTMCHTRVLSLRPHSLADLWKDILAVGEVTQKTPEAQDLVQSMKRRLAFLSASHSRQRPKVLCVEWLEPPMVGGGWIPELVRAAGGEPLLVTEPTRFQTVSWETVDSLDPDFIFVFPCGYPLEKTRREIQAATIFSPLSRLRAVREGHGYLCDGNAFFNRSGPRLVDSAEILCGLLHPAAEKLRTRHAAAFCRISEDMQ